MGHPVGKRGYPASSLKHHPVTPFKLDSPDKLPELAERLVLLANQDQHLSVEQIALLKVEFLAQLQKELGPFLPTK